MATHAQVHENLDVWSDTVRDGITYISAQPNVDRSRIAIMGHSLGGYLALRTASRDVRVKAVVEASGALDKTEINRMPPTLILHGAKDRTVPVEKAHRLDTVLQRLHTAHEMHIYPEEPHIYSRSAMLDVTQRIDRFLVSYYPVRRRDPLPR